MPVISRRFLLRGLAVKTNKGITKLPVRRATIPVEQTGNVALSCAALLGDLSLSEATRNDVLNDLSPVHTPIITYVIADCKHHRDDSLTENHVMDTLAKRLTAKREALGLSQTELAKKAKLKNQSIIGMLETGARKSSSHIPLIANALGVESLWLSSGQGPESKGSAKTYELTETAMKIALLANSLSQEKQDALLHFLTAEDNKQVNQNKKNLLPG